MAAKTIYAYYAELKKHLTGNLVRFEGCYDTEDEAEKAARAMIIQLYGKRPDWVPKFGGVKNSAVKGMTNDAIEKIIGLIGKISATGENVPIDIEQKHLAMQYINDVISSENNKSLVKYVTRASAVATYVPSPDEFLEPINNENVEDSVVNKVIGQVEEAKELNKYIDYKAFIKGISKISGSAAVMAIMQGYGVYNNLLHNPRNSFACVIGLVPLMHVEEIEIARSGKVLKFRATGSVFLAKQEGGGDDAMRVKGNFYGDEIAFLLFLWGLYYYGDPITKEINLAGVQGTNIIEIRKRVGDIMKLNDERAKPSVESYRTFAFVTRNVIIPNVYIESLSFEDTTETGMNVINYDILMRTYNKQKNFKLWAGNDAHTTYATTFYDETLAYHRMLEYSTNFIWRMIQQNSFVLNTGYWKVGVTKQGFGGNSLTRDVYYNIEVGDVIGLFAMGAVGFAGANFTTKGVTKVGTNILNQLATTSMGALS